MTRPSILIAEDEEPLRIELRRMLDDAWPDAEIVAVCADGREAIARFDTLRPTVCFLDIRMPGATGLDVAHHIDERAHVVFVTAYDEFAIDAFERGAVGYLLKPVKRPHLVDVVRRLRERLSTTRPPAMAALVAQLRRELGRGGDEQLQWITASVGDTVKLYAVDDVLAFVSRDKYTQVLTEEDDAVIRTSLKELRRRLGTEVFWTVHRSALVRAGAIERVVRGSDGRHHLKLRGRDERIPVSAGFRARLKAM